MAFDWATVISAGVNLAEGMLEDDANDATREQSRENIILQNLDNERDRANRLLMSQEGNKAQLEAAKISAGAQLEATKKRIMGDVLLKQGDAQGEAMLEGYRAAANAPERFNTAANILAQVLAR